MYLKRKEVQLICRMPTWEWTVTWLSDSPNWVRQGRICLSVPIGCDKCVIRSVSLFVHMVAAAVDTLSWRLIGVALVPGLES